MPQLIQILLPLSAEDGTPFSPEAYVQVREELTKRFGGLTAFTRAPAEGMWKDGGDRTSRDDIVVFEIMSEDLDVAWWRGYRRELEARFDQDSIVIRAQETYLL